MQAASSRVERRRGNRRLLATIHLWLGLSVGALFALTGLTGSALVFYQEIDLLLNPDLRGTPTDSRPSSYEAVYEALRAHRSDGTGHWSIEIPPDGGTITSRFLRGAVHGRAAERRIVSVDPDTLEVLRDAPWGGYAMTWIYDLHQQLLLEQSAGRTLMGVVGLIVVGFLGTGVAVWWPRPGQWRNGLRFVRDASPVRRLLEIHQSLGLCGAVFLAGLALTGAMICLPSPSRALLSFVSAIEAFPAVSSDLPERGTRIPVDAAMESAERRYPDARVVWIDVPSTPDGTYQVRMRQPEEPSRRFPRTYVWIDQYSGDVLAARTTRGEGVSDAVLTWLHPLHAGEAFGLVGRIAVFVLGLLPAALLVTGALRWFGRRAVSRAPRAEGEPSASS